ncbi:hypothetical protein SAMN04488539_0313 [Corynebacterium timonense]|uniref:Uncharacterized protein n=1 Tax=Corynebacterium timonense TaxID=441500 RepID=A0A1H1LRK0_9CORY|nr:hypothetical protein SAMN04488539_0313 [Corynebacterium timonense]
MNNHPPAYKRSHYAAAMQWLAKLEITLIDLLTS